MGLVNVPSLACAEQATDNSNTIIGNRIKAGGKNLRNSSGYLIISGPMKLTASTLLTLATFGEARLVADLIIDKLMNISGDRAIHTYSCRSSSRPIYYDKWQTILFKIAMVVMYKFVGSDSEGTIDQTG